MLQTEQYQREEETAQAAQEESKNCDEGSKAERVRSIKMLFQYTFESLKDLFTGSTTTSNRPSSQQSGKRCRKHSGNEIVVLEEDEYDCIGLEETTPDGTQKMKRKKSVCIRARKQSNESHAEHAQAGGGGNNSNNVAKVMQSSGSVEQCADAAPNLCAQAPRMSGNAIQAQPDSEGVAAPANSVNNNNSISSNNNNNNNNSNGGANQQQAGENLHWSTSDTLVIQGVEAYTNLLGSSLNSSYILGSSGVKRASSQDAMVSVTAEGVQEVVEIENRYDGSDGVVILCPQPKEEFSWEMIETGQRQFSAYTPAQLLKVIKDGMNSAQRKLLWLHITERFQANSQNVNSHKPYIELRQKQPLQHKIIQQDIKRTYVSQDYFRKEPGSVMLTHVLQAYANFDIETGYVQGMSCIAAALLHHILPESEEERNDLDAQVVDEMEELAFKLFVNIMEYREWKTIFMEGFPGYFRQIERLERDLKQLHPEVYDQIKRSEAQLSQPDVTGMPQLLPAIFTPYIMTIMLYNTPSEMAKRMLDFFLIQGEDALYAVIFKMIELCKDQIREIPDHDVQRLKRFFHCDILNVCNSKIIDKAQQTPFDFFVCE